MAETTPAGMTYAQAYELQRKNTDKEIPAEELTDEVHATAVDMCRSEYEGFDNFKDKVKAPLIINFTNKAHEFVKQRKEEEQMIRKQSSEAEYKQSLNWLKSCPSKMDIDFNTNNCEPSQILGSQLLAMKSFIELLTKNSSCVICFLEKRVTQLEEELKNATSKFDEFEVRDENYITSSHTSSRASTPSGSRSDPPPPAPAPNPPPPQKQRGIDFCFLLVFFLSFLFLFR